MNFSKIYHLTAFLFIFLLSTVATSAQTSYKVGDKSSMFILGTSNLHDWESEVIKLDGKATMNLYSKQLESIEELSFSAFVESIESGNSIMNGKTYRALKSDEHPNITYELTKFEIKDGKIIQSKGLLTVAGVTKEIDFPVEFDVVNRDINVTGAIKFKMTDFGVSPPTALFGTLTTGDEITISFSMNFTEPNS